MKVEQIMKVWRSKPKWAIKDFFKDAELDGYAGVGPYRWWRGNHKWASGFLWGRFKDGDWTHGPRTRKWCEFPYIGGRNSG